MLAQVIFVVAIFDVVHSFVSTSTSHALTSSIRSAPLMIIRKSSKSRGSSNKSSSILYDQVLSDNDDFLSSFFTGGIFENEKNIVDDEASKIASKIKSSQTLGWKTTGNNRRKKGSMRPRHRAFGGEGEKPVQLKPAYDETSSFSPEKWLTQEDMNTYLKCKPGPASDTVFVALAGGAKYAERDVCEKKIEEWSISKKFNKEAFMKSVQQGRQDLIIGWVLYLTLSGTAAAGIIFPNNPLNLQLVKLIEYIIDSSATTT